MDPRLARIRIYPIKSLDPFEVDSVGLAAGKSLEGDREYALFDPDGTILNAKRLGSALLKIRAEYSGGGREVRLASEGIQGTFRLPDDREDMERWLASRLDQPVAIRRDRSGGYPDDTAADGPTLVGTASLAAVARHFDLPLEEVRRRFRANLEIDGLEPFGEDLLFGPPDSPRPFRLGSVDLLGTNPCRRCSVPTRDSFGRSGRGPLQPRTFAEFRASANHPRSLLSSYPGGYRFAVNTRLAAGQQGRLLRAGDRLEVPA